jgi:hypothetical protein
MRETFTISSKNYAKTLACARFLDGKLPTLNANISVGSSCPVFDISGKRYKLEDIVICSNKYDKYNGIRSCVTVEKGM